MSAKPGKSKGATSHSSISRKRSRRGKLSAQDILAGLAEPGDHAVVTMLVLGDPSQAIALLRMEAESDKISVPDPEIVDARDAQLLRAPMRKIVRRKEPPRTIGMAFAYHRNQDAGDKARLTLEAWGEYETRSLPPLILRLTVLHGALLIDASPLWAQRLVDGYLRDFENLPSKAGKDRPVWLQVPDRAKDRAIVRHYIQGLEVKDIASKLFMGTSTVNERLRKLRKQGYDIGHRRSK